MDCPAALSRGAPTLLTGGAPSGFGGLDPQPIRTAMAPTRKSRIRLITPQPSNEPRTFRTVEIDQVTFAALITAWTVIPYSEYSR